MRSSVHFQPEGAQHGNEHEFDAQLEGYDQGLSTYVQDNFDFLDQMDCSVLDHVDCSVSYQVCVFTFMSEGWRVFDHTFVKVVVDGRRKMTTFLTCIPFHALRLYLLGEGVLRRTPWSLRWWVYNNGASSAFPSSCRVAHTPSAWPRSSEWNHAKASQAA